MSVSPESLAADLADPTYRAAIVDLLGGLAYGELQAFERLAADAAMCPDFQHRTATAEMAIGEFGHFKLLRERLIELGADPDEAMAPFVAAIDGFHASTTPNDWLEGMVKAYVGDGIAMDFYRSVARYVDPHTKALIIEVCDDLGHSAFVIETIREAIEADPKVAGRLALWGRRLMGEVVAQSQVVVATREGLIDLIMGGIGPDLADIARMFNELTDAHSDRMRSLGMSP